jgi:hypothetical protein
MVDCKYERGCLPPFLRRPSNAWHYGDILRTHGLCRLQKFVEGPSRLLYQQVIQSKLKDMSLSK